MATAGAGDLWRQLASHILDAYFIGGVCSKYVMRI